MPTELSQEQLAQIHAAIFSHQKIGAIRLYREFVGGELIDAKNAVEKMAAVLEAKEPTKFAPKPKGCGTVAVILVIFAIAIAIGLLVNR